MSLWLSLILTELDQWMIESPPQDLFYILVFTPFAWSYKKQFVIALSTIDVEYQVVILNCQ